MQENTIQLPIFFCIPMIKFLKCSWKSNFWPIRISGSAYSGLYLFGGEDYINKNALTQVSYFNISAGSNIIKSRKIVKRSFCCILEFLIECYKNAQDRKNKLFYDFMTFLPFSHIFFSVLWEILPFSCIFLRFTRNFAILFYGHEMHLFAVLRFNGQMAILWFYDFI